MLHMGHCLKYTVAVGVSLLISWRVTAGITVQSLSSESLKPSRRLYVRSLAISVAHCLANSGYICSDCLRPVSEMHWRSQYVKDLTSLLDFTTTSCSLSRCVKSLPNRSPLPVQQYTNIEGHYFSMLIEASSQYLFCYITKCLYRC